MKRAALVAPLGLLMSALPCLAQDAESKVYGSWTAVYEQDPISDSVVTQRAYAANADDTVELTISCENDHVASATFHVSRVFGGATSTVTLRFDKLRPFTLTGWTWGGHRLTPSERQDLSKSLHSNVASVRSLAQMAVILASMSLFTLDTATAREFVRTAMARQVLAFDISPTADDVGEPPLRGRISLVGLTRALRHIHCQP